MNAPSLALLTLLALSLAATPLEPLQGRGGAGRGARPPAAGGAKERPPAKPEQGPSQQERKARADEQEQMAARFFKVADYDHDGWISFREGRDSLELDRQRFTYYDTDRDGRITREEFTTVYRATIRKVGAFKPPIPDPTDPDALSLEELLAEGEEPEEVVEVPKATTVLELFGKVEPREEEEHVAAQPDRIVGPVPSFRRVDYDADGGITREDLRELLLGAGIRVHVDTLLSALDEDGDGRIDEAEFEASMRHRDLGPRSTGRPLR